MGLDGGCVHASDQKSRTEGWFEVITGKSIKTEGGGAKVFAFVNKYDTKPKRRLYEVLKAQGLQMNQQVVFLSDGGDTVRDMQAYLSPQSEHLLDWFHITMRLTVIGQLVKGMGAELTPDGRYPLTSGILASLGKNLESVKWNLWHGNVAHALPRMNDLDDDLETLEETPQNKKKLEKAVKELRGYISANEAFIPNYGDRYRHDEMTSTAFVESTVNQVISKRFVKKQQMRWTQRGAHESGTNRGLGTIKLPSAQQPNLLSHHVLPQKGTSYGKPTMTANPYQIVQPPDCSTLLLRTQGS